MEQKNRLLISLAVIALVVFAMFTMLVNLIVDISYKWIDPRVSFDKEGA